jgi:hypothetical protein
MNRVDIDHPAIKEMISSRSDGDPGYVAGVRAFLTEGGTPSEGSIAYNGYRDAHDMTAYLSDILADLRADEYAEERKVFRLRAMELENGHWAPQTRAERPLLVQEIKTKQSRSMRP